MSYSDLPLGTEGFTQFYWRLHGILIAVSGIGYDYLQIYSSTKHRYWVSSLEDDLWKILIILSLHVYKTRNLLVLSSMLPQKMKKIFAN